MSEDISAENSLRQSEEIEALSAIYGEDFFIVDKESSIFEIRIRYDDTWASLRFVLPPGYPSEDPPEFEVQCSLLKSNDELELIQEFQQIAEENLGECFVFQWAEKLRDIVEKKANEAQEFEQEANCRTLPEKENNAEDLMVEAMIDVMARTSVQENNLLSPKAEYNLKPQFEIAHGEPFTDRKSTFQAHLAVVMSRNDVDQALFQLKLNRKIAHATHNIVAYRIINEKTKSYYQDCDDDGENAAGSRLLHLLQVTDAKNVLIVVTRWYGGLLLGPDRFKHINNCARNLLESCGFIEGKKSNENKELKGKRTAKMKKHK